MLDTVKINHVQHISFTQSRLTDAVSVILSELLSYEHPSKGRGGFFSGKVPPLALFGKKGADSYEITKTNPQKMPVFSQKTGQSLLTNHVWLTIIFE